MKYPLAGRRVAVVGATGFIGSHLTERLVWNGANVLAVTRSVNRLENLKSVVGECQVTVADILDRQSIGDSLRDFKPETVYHLAADVDASESFGHMTKCLESNAIGTANVLEAAHGGGAELVVYGDSSKVYGNGPVPYRESQPEAPICSYAVGKCAGWQLCRLVRSLTGMAVSSLRPTFVYGPRQNPNLITYVEKCARLGQPVRLMGGSQTRDLLYVGDAVRAFIATATEHAAWGRAIPIGGGCEITVARLCRKILELLDSRVAIIADAQKPRQTEIWRSYCDNAEARELLGWSPEVSLTQGLRSTLFDGLPEVRSVEHVRTAGVQA